VLAAPEAARPTIEGIRLVPQAIFDSVQTQFWAYSLLNKLHIVTKPSVLKDELLLKRGQPFDSALAAETERNLRALGLFQDVRVDTVSTDSGVIVRVRTRDGWTTYPTISLGTVGSQVVFGAGLLERNLLGTGALAYIRYQRNPDRSSFLVGYEHPRWIAHTVNVGGSYEHRSDGQQAVAFLQYPFFSLESLRGGSLFAQWMDTRVLQFRDGNATASDTLQRRFAILAADWAVAPLVTRSSYLHVGLSGQIRRDDFLPQGSTASFTQTVTGALGPFVEFRRPRFVITSGYRSFGRSEDVDLGILARLTALAAPSAFGYERNGVGSAFSGAIGAPLPFGFALFNVESSGLFTGGGLDSGSVTGSGTLVVQPGPRHLLVGNVTVGAMKSPYPGEEFDLGLGFGARAFPAHAFTGDRAFIASSEYRYVLVPQLFGVVGLGVAGFVDYAGAWYAGSSRRTGTDYGVGLRIAPIAAAHGLFLRLDLAYRQANDVEPGGLVFVVGQSFAFEKALGLLR
jgi:hypothetical protein